MRRIVLASGFFLMAIGGIALADTKAGLDAFAVADYPRAAAEFQAAGEAGDVWGWFYLANMTADGTGVAQDLPKARTLYEKAAAAGHTGAQLRLGNMYRRGFGGDADVRVALQWLMRAVEAGNAEAALYAGDIYATGEGGIEPSDELGTNLFEIAAIQGQPHAMAKLGLMLFEGRGRKADAIEGLKWLTLASEFLEGEAKTAVDEEIARRTRDMSPSDQAEARKRAAEWDPDQA